MQALQAKPLAAARCSTGASSARLPMAAARVAATPRHAGVPARRAVLARGAPPGYGPSNIPEPGPERHEWPFPTFIKNTLAKFPDAGVCTCDEARVLNEEGGYTFLDVRSKAEHEYKISGSVNIPIINATWKFSSEQKRKVPTQSANADFVKQVQAKFKPDAKLIVVCSDGRVRCLAALQALDAAGFTNIVGMKQGYNGFSRIFDAKFNRRVAPDVMREVDAPDFLDQSTGIFGTGASYDRVDSVPWVPVKDPESWIDWHQEVEKLALAK